MPAAMVGTPPPDDPFSDDNDQESVDEDYEAQRAETIRYGPLHAPLMCKTLMYSPGRTMLCSLNLASTRVWGLSRSERQQARLARWRKASRQPNSRPSGKQGPRKCSVGERLWRLWAPHDGADALRPCKKERAKRGESF